MFFVVITFVVGLNLLWYLISDRWLRHELVRYPVAKKLTRAALLAWMLIIFVPILFLITGQGNPLEYGPWIWLAVFYIWMGAILLWMTGLGVLGVRYWGIKLFRKKPGNREQSEHQRKQQSVYHAEDQPEQRPEQQLEQQTRTPPGRLTRRQLMKIGLVAAPPLLVGSTAIGSAFAKDKLAVRTIDLPVRNLPFDLEGYTITHLSDLHIGMVTGRERAERIIETANELKSHSIVITGDILDNNIDYMPDLIETIGELRADQGVYLCIGNHDKIHDGTEWVSSVRDAGFNLLLDESMLVDTGGTPIKLLGIDYSHSGSDDLRNIRRAYENTQTPDQSLKILLAHHPHAFDATAQTDIAVTLAGHTHGGQLAFRVGDQIELFNAGNLIFRYVDGIYRQAAGKTLFVHRGSGDWFPLRVGVPTDVVQLRLVREEV